jgi:glutaredoxin-related protein
VRGTNVRRYIKGKLVGGLDIMNELHEDGELAGMKPDAAE